jgi:hypothetical protein
MLAILVTKLISYILNKIKIIYLVILYLILYCSKASNKPYLYIAQYKCLLNLL